MKALIRRPGRNLVGDLRVGPMYWANDPTLRPGSRPARLDPDGSRRLGPGEPDRPREAGRQAQPRSSTATTPSKPDGLV